MNLPKYKNINKFLKNAVDKLSVSQIEQRLIAINELKELGSKYPEQYDNIILIMTNFIIKERSLNNLKDSDINPISEINSDVQLALNIITNPDIDRYLRRDRFNLSYVDIRGANLCGANLKKVNLRRSILYRANLIDANLENANLTGAVLSAANLKGANLAWASLCGAILNAANLYGTNLTHADLRCANLFLANLQKANLSGANLNGANLREAEFSGNKATPEA
ncbi:pentapeptide repeat-containing protein [Calothrix sp. CCY 0018]|uniref:pentapeptide repeat-containing protein n=1 Tax=Calothrix sp. CCY 0018 TaxID=3103864 RepID=UPI0039C6D3A9